MPLTGVMNCVFLHIFTYHLTAAACNLRHQPATVATCRYIRLAHWQKVLKIHKYCRNNRVYFCPSAQDNSSSGVNNSSLRTQKGVFLGPECCWTAWCLQPRWRNWSRRRVRQRAASLSVNNSLYPSAGTPVRLTYGKKSLKTVLSWSKFLYFAPCCLYDVRLKTSRMTCTAATSKSLTTVTRSNPVQRLSTEPSTLPISPDAVPLNLLF